MGKESKQGEDKTQTLDVDFSQLEVVPIALDDICPYPKNAQVHTEESVAKMVRILREFGWRDGLTIEQRAGNMLVMGHRRWMAATVLREEDPKWNIAPCKIADDLSPALIKALRLVDNRADQDSESDMGLVKLEMIDLQDLGVDLDLTGFSELEQVTMLASDGVEFGEEEGENGTPEIEADAVSVTGDLWALGEHRLLCGDSTKASDVDRLLGDDKPHLMVTDPPYGVEYDADWRSSLDQWNRATKEVKNDDQADWSEVYALFPGNVAYVWHPPGATSLVFAESLMACDFEIRMQIIWVKPHFPIGRGHYHVQHEPCFYAVRKGRTGHWQGSRKESTRWDIDNALFQSKNKSSPEEGKSGHSTQKPVECMRRPMRNNSKKGDTVYEPFCGSGTSIIAAETIERRCLAIEIHPQYCDMSIKRWQSFTNQQATLDGDGRTFDEVAAARLATEAAE